MARAKKGPAYVAILERMEKLKDDAKALYKECDSLMAQALKKRAPLGKLIVFADGQKRVLKDKLVAGAVAHFTPAFFRRYELEEYKEPKPAVDEKTIKTA